MKRHVFPNDYPELNLEKMMIHIVESGDRLLGAMSEKSSAAAEKYIRNMGVHVLLNTRVVNYDGNTVKLNNGETIAAKTLIWSAGVKGKVETHKDAVAAKVAMKSVLAGVQAGAAAATPTVEGALATGLSQEASNTLDTTSAKTLESISVEERTPIKIFVKERTEF